MFGWNKRWWCGWLSSHYLPSNYWACCALLIISPPAMHGRVRERERDRAFIEERRWIWCGYWRTRVWWGEAVNFHMRVSEEIPYQLLTRSMSVCVCVCLYIYIYIYMNKLCFLSILKNVAKQVQSFWVVEATFIIWAC